MGFKAEPEADVRDFCPSSQEDRDYRSVLRFNHGEGITATFSLPNTTNEVILVTLEEIHSWDSMSCASQRFRGFAFEKVCCIFRCIVVPL